MIYKDMFNRLPERFRKSNTKDLYKVLNSSYDALNEVIGDVEDSRDIDKAFGETLDKIGWNVGVLRKTEEDDLFRQLIKVGIVANLSKGDIPTINQVAKILIGKGFMGINETWNMPEYDNEPAGLALTMRNQTKNLPFAAIDRTVAGGVDVKWILELKQEESEVFVASATLSGEEITVYPYSISEIDSKVNVFIGIGHNTGTEEISVYPRKEVI